MTHLLSDGGDLVYRPAPLSLMPSSAHAPGVAERSSKPAPLCSDAASRAHTHVSSSNEGETIRLKRVIKPTPNGQGFVQVDQRSHDCNNAHSCVQGQKVSTMLSKMDQIPFDSP